MLLRFVASNALLHRHLLQTRQILAKMTTSSNASKKHSFFAPAAGAASSSAASPNKKLIMKLAEAASSSQAAEPSSTLDLKRRKMVISDDEEDDEEALMADLCVAVKNPSPVAKKLKENSTPPDAKSAPAKKKVPKKDIKEEPAADIKEAEDPTWPQGGTVPFSALCATFELIEATTKRLIISDYLTKFLIKVMTRSPDDLLAIIYLCVNQLGPTWEASELGIGESVLMKAIASTTGRSVQSVKSDMQKKGDLGTVAQESRCKQRTMFKPKPLTVQAVFKGLEDISKITGQSSQQKKIDKITSLFVASKDHEAKFLIRALEGKLRIGLAEATVLTSLAHASVNFRLIGRKKLDKETMDEKLANAAAVLKQVYNEIPTYVPIIPVLLQNDIGKLPELCKLTPGIPLKPMLAHPTKSLTDVLNRFDGIPFTCEYKYDGERAQIHRFKDGTLKIYSRNQENMSAKYPDIINSMKEVSAEGVESYVLDSEAVAWDLQKKQILPFQVLSTRKRKDVEEKDIAVKVCVFAFDMLYLNGESLVHLPLAERRKKLQESFVATEGKFAYAKSMEGQTVDDIQLFLDESIEGNCEGLMVKTMNDDSSYEPSKRSRNWLKVKKDYLAGVGDSLDLVVIGGYHGKGKRTGMLGGFLIACYDEEREEYQAISKIATGFSEEDLATHTEFFKEHKIEQAKPYYAVSDSIKPDIWFDAVQVWEVKAADLSISPIYSAGIGHVDANKGISLRFPRFIRIRDDKKPDEATNATQVAGMYRAQNLNTASTNALEDDAY